MSVYLDTSALAKRYLNESRSADFERYFLSAVDPVVSSLTVAEMRSLLARHRRSGHFDAAVEARIHALFEEDIAGGHLLLRPLENEHALAAGRLIHGLPAHPLRTLDALHLAVAQGLGAEELATADRVMAAAAEALDLRVVRFD
jgi:predicted nucleic acid-binding protein